MITLEDDRLVFRFPKVHKEAVCAIDFQRTLRLPDDGKDWPLPPGLGRFPLRHLDDLADRVPAEWYRRGGVLMPMYQAEAMWLSFSIRGSGFGSEYPFAVKVAAGKVNALTGERWVDHLNRDPQDYLVLPTQPWLDGFCVEKGVVRQFVAMPLGRGYSAEEQITRAAAWGGLQLVVYPMKAASYRRIVSARSGRAAFCMAPPEPMGLAPGGRMRQEVYRDPYQLDDWDQRHLSRCFVSIVDATTWLALTRERPPGRPPSAKDYTEAGLPWFDYYDGDAAALEGAARLMGLSSVLETAAAQGDDIPIEDEGPVPGRVLWLGPDERGRPIREPH